MCVFTTSYPPKQIQPGTARIGVWEAACDKDYFEPVARRLPDLVVGAGVTATQAQLQTACEGVAPPTPADTGANNALCSSMISVTENTANKAITKLGSSAWYNWAPTVTYTLIGGYQNQAFTVGAALLGANAQRYCIYWPTANAAVGKSGGGTNKWAKPVIKTITTTLAATNAPAGAARYADPAAAAAAAALVPPRPAAPLVNPIYQESITVNYFKSGPPASGL